MKHSTYPLILQIVIAMLFVRFVRVEAFTKVPRVPCMQSSPLAAPSLAERIVVRDEKPPTLVKVVAHLPLLASVLVARTRELWREAREGGQRDREGDARGGPSRRVRPLEQRLRLWRQSQHLGPAAARHSDPRSPLSSLLL